MVVEPRKPYAPLNVTEGDTVIADGRVAVTIHWMPPLESDLPITRYKAGAPYISSVGCSKPVIALQQISRKPRKTVLMHF